MATHTYKKEDDDDIFPTVFTVPVNRPWVLSKEEAAEFMKNAPTRKITREERAAIIKEAEKLFKKPEKKKDE